MGKKLLNISYEEEMRQALNECMSEAGMGEKEMRAFIFRLATNTLTESDHVLLRKRNEKAHKVIH